MDFGFSPLKQDKGDLTRKWVIISEYDIAQGSSLANLSNSVLSWTVAHRAVVGTTAFDVTKTDLKFDIVIAKFAAISFRQ